MNRIPVFVGLDYHQDSVQVWVEGRDGLVLANRRFRALRPSLPPAFVPATRLLNPQPEAFVFCFLLSAFGRLAAL